MIEKVCEKCCKCIGWVVVTFLPTSRAFLTRTNLGVSQVETDLIEGTSLGMNQVYSILLVDWTRPVDYKTNRGVEIPFARHFVQVKWLLSKDFSQHLVFCQCTYKQLLNWGSRGVLRARVREANKIRSWNPWASRSHQTPRNNFYRRLLLLLCVNEPWNFLVV